jgi:nucleotide-binding universal stress UspA family protein
LQLGASLQYIYLTNGILIGLAVVPIALTVSWKKTNKSAVILGSLLGLIAGICSWVTTTWLLYVELSIATTGETTAQLIGNIISISVGAGVMFIGSLVRPQNFNFELMKLKILVVDYKIRSLIQKDTDEKQSRRDVRFTYRYSIALSLVLVVVWPLPLYFSGYVFSLQMYSFWVGIAVAWTGIAACVIVLLPLIESRAGIMQVLKRMTDTSALMRHGVSDSTTPPSETRFHTPEEDTTIQLKKVLVAIVGSLSSLRALSYAESIFTRNRIARVYMLHVMEWTDDEDESVDAAIISQMEKEGRKMLRSLAISRQYADYEKVVRLGDPATKIVEIADRLDVDLIVMGKVLSRAGGNIGYVTSKVLQLTSRPVTLIR